MRGVISALAPDGTYGQIAADDGQRYSYWTSEVRNGAAHIHDAVNFQIADGQPVDIFLMPKPGQEAPPPPRAGMPRAAPGAGRSPNPGGYAATPAGYGAPQSYAVGGEAIPTDKNYWIALFTSPAGRISRKQFWLHGVLPLIGAGIVLNVIGYTAIFIVPTFVLLLSLMVFLVLLWPQLCLSYKRFQDVGYPGWYNLFWIVPLLVAQVLSHLSLFFYSLLWLFGIVSLVLSSIAGLVLLAALILVFVRAGQQGPNAYGPDPLAQA